MRIFKCRYEVRGNHVHCRIFSGQGIGYTFAKLGNLCMDLKDWEDFKEQFDSFLFQEESTFPETAKVNITIETDGQITAEQAKA